MIRPWLELARISNLPTVWTNVLAGWLLAGGTWDWPVLAWLLAGGSLLYTGGMILNDAADVRFDREARKERPIPSGRVTAAAAWSVGIGFLLTGFAMFVWGAEACIWLTGSLVVAIVAYDLYHKPWAGSVFIMGSCRTLLYLAAASAVTGTLSFAVNYEVIIKAIALGGYIVGLSLVARNESAVGKPSEIWFGVGIFGLALPIQAFGFCMLVGPPRIFEPLWWMFLQLIIPALLLSLELFAMHRMRTPPPSNIGRAVGLLLAGIVLVDALAISAADPIAALVFALSFPFLLMWQRKIAAT